MRYPRPKNCIVCHRPTVTMQNPILGSLLSHREYKLQPCAVCREVLTREEIGALGHLAQDLICWRDTIWDGHEDEIRLGSSFVEWTDEQLLRCRKAYPEWIDAVLGSRDGSLIAEINLRRARAAAALRSDENDLVSQEENHGI